MASDGAVFDHIGQVVKPDGWEHDELTVDGCYTLQWQRDKGRARVFSPVTGESWDFAIPREDDRFEGGIASQDGRHALVVDKTALPKSVLTLLDRIHMASDWLMEHDERLYQMRLLEKPGRTRATINVEHLLKSCGGDYLNQLLLSPDGRVIIVTADSQDESEEDVILFRW